MILIPFKAIAFIACLILGLTTSLNLQANNNNALLVNPPWNAQNGASIVIRFSFPGSTANAIGPSAYGSSGLNYKQFIGVSFPASVGSADLLFDQGSTPKWGCELSDGTVTYAMTAVQPVASPVISTMVAESNVAFCRLDDTTSNVPLKTGASITYKLTISLASVKIASTQFLRAIGLFTSTSNNPERMIIDSIPVIGTAALYSDYATYSPKALDIMNASVVVTQGPSAAASGSVVYPYNQFDVVLTLKATTFITSADHVVVFKYPTDTVTPAGTAITADAAPNDALQVALKGNLSLKSFGTDGLYLDGISEDLIPNRQFKLTLKGWKSLDTNISTSKSLYVIVYYKNTYSILSYVSNNIFLVSLATIDITANHPEFWDVYESGAWPIAFTFKSTTNDLTSGGWVVIQQSNTLGQSTSAGNKITFIPSTCDFSANDNSFDNSFGKRPNCYPLRTLDTTYSATPTTAHNGSGFFFFMKGTITAAKTYYVTIWAFFDICSGTDVASYNVLSSSNTAWTKPSFQATLYKNINVAEINDARFTASGAFSQSIIAQSTTTAFGQQCWNNVMYEADSTEDIQYTAATTIARDTYLGTVDATKVGTLHYKEVFDWVAFSETADVFASELNTWFKDTSGATLKATSAQFRYVYSGTSTNVITSGSYFAVALTVYALVDNAVYMKLPFPTMKGDGTHPPGRWVWQFPVNWFTAGNGYKVTTSVTAPTCIAAWSFSAAGTSAVTAISDVKLLPVKTATGRHTYTAGTNTNFIGAFVSDGTNDLASTIDSTYTNLPPEITSATSGSAVRIVSTYHDITATPKWTVPVSGTTNTGATNWLTAVYYTSCLKWKTSAPSITSLYTYIDIQIKWNYIGTDGTTTAIGTTVGNTRLIKLFPETGVLNDFEKDGSAQSVNPLYSHTIYTTSPNDAICLIELNGSVIAAQKTTASNTLVVWLYWGTLLETDYMDTTSTYPVAPLVSGINVYGLQNGPSMDILNPYAAPNTAATNTPILAQFKNNNVSYSATANETINTDIATDMAFKNSSSYIWMMGSALYFTSVTTTSLTASTEVPFYFPYYCPQYISTYSTPTGTIGKAHIWPVVMASWMTANGFNSYTSMNKWVVYDAPGSTATAKSSKVFANAIIGTSSFPIKTVSATATLQTATLKWSPYTSTDSFLYVYNGTVSAAGTNDILCTGHTLLVHTSITIDTATMAFASGLSGAASSNLGTYNGSKTFYAFGKPFAKAVLYGLSSATIPTTGNMVKLTATGATSSSTYYTGVKRPSVDSFVTPAGDITLTDKVGYSCAAINNNKNEGLTNYVVDSTNSRTVRHFILDWQSNGGAWLTPSVAFDKPDVYKSDVAGNFKVVLSPPVSIPAGTILKFSANSNAITSNTICGLIVSTGAIVKECTLTSSTTINCTTPAAGTSFTVCCYNIVVSDPLSLATVTASFPPDSKVAGVGTYQTLEVYTAATQIASNANPFSFVTANAQATDVIGTKAATITGIQYSQVNQEGGIGKVTFTVNLPREPTRDMKISLVGDLSGMVIAANIPRCVASFGKDSLFGSNWDNGDVLIDTCSSNNIQSGTPVVVTTKKMVYKCGIPFSKSLYISLWPIVVVNWAGASVNKSFKVTMQLNGASENIALNTQAFDMTLSSAVAAKPNFPGQWDTLCAVSSVTPKLPGEVADYIFDFDLDTNKSSLTNSNPNEVSIFFPYQYYGAFIPNVLCYYSGLLNCSFTDEGILNVRFSSNLAIGSGKKISITIVGITNPAIDGDYSFPCTVNNSNFSTGARTNLLTGSGKLTGGITTTSVTTHGALKFQQISTPVTDKNPRNVSVHRFRLSFDWAVNLTASPVTIANTPVLHVYFPSDYKLAWYTNKPSATIDEYTSDANNLITKTSTIAPATITQSGNRISITFTQTSYTFPSNWRYWDLTITNIINPTDTTVQTSAPVSQTTRPFSVTLTNTSLTSLYRTYTNLNSYASDVLTTAIDSNIGWNRGNSFVFDNSKWVVDIYSASTQLNVLTVKAGRYLQSYFTIKANSSNALVPWVSTLSLSDTIFKTSMPSYLLSTSYQQPLGFWVGCPCGTAPGYYLVNFSSTDTTNFSALSPIVFTVDTSSKGTISYQTPPTIPAAGSVWIGIILSEPNFDQLAVNWAAGDNSKNDESAKITNVTIPAATITPTSTSSTSGSMSPIYSIFSVTSSSTTLGPQAFKTSDPNACFSWNGANTISFNISGQTAIIPSSLNLASYFKYVNADTDTTISAKNSIKFTFTPPASPIFVYCALACINMAYPADADIQAPKVASTNFLKFYSNVISSVSPIDIVFTELVRGQQYHMRCMIQSTQGDSTLRTSSSVNFENFSVVGTTNSTTVNIVPSNPTATQCAQWQFLSEPGTQTRIAVVNYCQKLFSAPGWWNNGCVICTYSDMTYNTPGLFLPTNITCPTTTTKTRLRFLQTPSIIPPNVTADVPTTLTVCPIPHPICATDVSGNRVYADFFNQMINDLKTTTLFKQTLNIDNVRLNSTVPTVTVTDAAVPDITKLTSAIVSSAATGAVSFTLAFPTPLVCYWQISDSATAPSFASIQGCTDASWCGKTKAGPVSNTVSTTNLKAFTPGSTYNVYVACTNDIPMAQKLAIVKSAGSFTIAAPTPTVTPPIDNSTTIGSSFINYSLAVVFMISALLI